MTNLLFIALGFFLGFLWFSVAVLPIFYGLPKAIIWTLRRWSVWRGTVYWLIPSIVWSLCLLGLAIGFMVLFPELKEKVEGSFESAWAFGLLFGAVRAISPSGRSDLRMDFLDRMKAHLTPEGLTKNADLLAALNNESAA